MASKQGPSKTVRIDVLVSSVGSDVPIDVEVFRPKPVGFAVTGDFSATPSYITLSTKAALKAALDAGQQTPVKAFEQLAVTAAAGPVNPCNLDLEDPANVQACQGFSRPKQEGSSCYALEL